MLQLCVVFGPLWHLASTSSRRSEAFMIEFVRSFFNYCRKLHVWWTAMKDVKPDWCGARFCKWLLRTAVRKLNPCVPNRLKAIEKLTKKLHSYYHNELGILGFFFSARQSWLETFFAINSVQKLQMRVRLLVCWDIEKASRNQYM